jgi:hypothetical protein
MEHQELKTIILDTFATGNDLSAYLNLVIFPAFRDRAATEKRLRNDARLAELVQGKADRAALKKSIAEARHAEDMRAKGLVWFPNKGWLPPLDPAGNICPRCNLHWARCRCGLPSLK